MSADDDLERRLRNVFRSRRLSIDSDAGLLDRVHAGAARRHRRRAAAATLSSVAVVAAVSVAAGTLALGQHGSHRLSADNRHGNSPSILTASPPHSPAPTNDFGKPTAPTSTFVTAPGFYPVSVSAISIDTYWVLGYRVGTESNGRLIGDARLVKTTDGGKHFSNAAAPGVLVADAPIERPPNQPLVTDIRFGDANNGWAYGGSLFSTTDGGNSWSAVRGVPGSIVDLVAANGVAWAVVDLSAIPGSPPTTPNPRFAIYSTPYGKSPQHWAPVTLPLADLGGVQPSIVDQDGTVTLMVSGPLRNGHHEHVLIAKPGGAFTDHEAPCIQDMGGYLSNSKKAIWASCPTGTSAALFVSADRGATWRAASGPERFPNPASGIGAIDDQHAVVMNYATGTLLRVGASGPDQPVDAPTQGAAGAKFIGFTTQDTGLAVVDYQQGGTTELLRTTDGGLHWTRVQIHP